MPARRCAFIGLRSSVGTRPSILKTVSVCFLFRGHALFDDFASGEQYRFEFLAPEWGAAEEEFEIHSEVLEFLFLGIFHDGPRFRVAFDSNALLVPANRLRLFDE